MNFWKKMITNGKTNQSTWSLASVAKTRVRAVWCHALSNWLSVFGKRSSMHHHNNSLALNFKVTTVNLNLNFELQVKWGGLLAMPLFHTQLQQVSSIWCLLEFGAIWCLRMKTHWWCFTSGMCLSVKLIAFFWVVVTKKTDFKSTLCNCLHSCQTHCSTFLFDERSDGNIGEISNENWLVFDSM